MKNEVILNLAEKYERQAEDYGKLPQCGAPDSAVSNAKNDGRVEAKLKCAEDLRLLIKLLG